MFLLADKMTGFRITLICATGRNITIMIIQKTCTPASLFSGDRFSVTYRLFGTEKEARSKAEDICIEQTVEFPADEVPEGVIRDHVFGRIESFEPSGR